MNFTRGNNLLTARDNANIWRSSGKLIMLGRKRSDLADINFNILLAEIKLAGKVKCRSSFVGVSSRALAYFCPASANGLFQLEAR